MKKLLHALWIAVIACLVFHVVLFNANESYCTRLYNKDYSEGRTTVTYYSSVWN